MATALFLVLFCFFIYNANLRQIGSGDTMPARYMPLILWHHGTLALDADARLLAHGHSMIAPRNRPASADTRVVYFEPWPYWMIRTREHRVASLYPVVSQLLVAPLYLPAVLWLDRNGWQQLQIDRAAEVMEKLSASLLAALASAIMYLVLRRDGNRWSLPLALAFAFGTNTWMISSQALWQHGTGELLIALALLLALARATPARTAVLGAVCLLMAANRPPDALIAGAIGLFILWSRRRAAVWFFVGAAVPLAALLYYNLNFIGHIVGGYAIRKNPNRAFFHPDWSGLLGLLISPARGLLVFSPFLVFVPVGLIQRLRMPATKNLAIVLGLAALAQFLVYSQADWRAGVSWGPRWLTDLLPILVWMLAPAPLVLRPFARGLLVLTMVASVAVQAIGAFWYTKVSDELLYAGGSASMSSAWDVGNIPFLTELRHPPARAELLYDARGSLDRVGSALVRTLDEVPRLEPGAVLEGWALTGRRTPAQMLVLIDGIVVGSTEDFLPRADVNEELHTTSPSGWRITASLWGVAPGERVLQLAVRVDPRSDARIIREQRVVVVAQELEEQVATLPPTPVSESELGAMAARAAALLQAQQNKEGYWLTAHTKSLRYEAPGQEMNTYVTSVLVDLLAPLARQHGLDDVVSRARTHLAAQIESNGLVRYHGLPDAPTIGTLGCAITPDSDDTALVWRIAGGATDSRRQAMLEELARYRDARGLYRTWLAPKAQYQCIDPGTDPNPADLAIQMHIYLMLREFDLSAAQSLCSALQRSFWDEDIWPYYAKTALVPYLRSAELGQLGCPLPLPSERLALPAAGQEIWSEAARLLLASPQDTNRHHAIRSLLARIGSGDFALLRSAPPLLYHNDLSANVRRYYWSEDVGYALWLRLYEAARLEAGQLRQPSL